MDKNSFRSRLTSLGYRGWELNRIMEAAEQTPDLPTNEEAQEWADTFKASVDAHYCAIGKTPTVEEIRQRPVEQFSYQPLDHTRPTIRLVHLLPDLTPAGLIQCGVSHASISSTYVCLSYVWDVPGQVIDSQLPRNPNTRVILMNGQPLRIRPNLFAFLQMARHNATRDRWNLERLDLSIPFWIDAICIDQLNTSERNHQVKQMGDIYSRAKSVQVWLGTAPSWESENGIPKDLPKTSRYQRYLKRVMVPWKSSSQAKTQFQEEPGLFRSYLEKIMDDWRWGVSDPSQKYDKTYALALSRFLFENPYWQRAWVVQEFRLASSLTIWIHTYPLGLKSLRSLWYRKPVLGAESLSAEHYLQYHTDTYGTSQELGIPEALLKFRDKRCANPRDRVFSLLSICSGKGSSIVVDYNIALSGLAYAVLSLQSDKVCLCSAAVVMHALTEGTLEVWSTLLYNSGGPWIEFLVSDASATWGQPDNLLQCVCPNINFTFSTPRWSLRKKLYSNMLGTGSGKHAVVRIPLCELRLLVDKPKRLCNEAQGKARLGGARRLEDCWVG